MTWTAESVFDIPADVGMVDRWIGALGRWYERLRANRAVQAAPRTLLDWETESHREIARFGVLNRRALGVRAIDVRRIAGSVTAAREWDGRFQPRRRDRHELQRFASVLSAMEWGKALPPITVYKLRRVYYVVDGRHRVGAAKQLGWDMIAADVTVLVPSGDIAEVALFHERQSFEATTNLLLVEASQPGTYPSLLREIHSYEQDHMRTAGIGGTMLGVSTRWYYHVFMPAITLIRGSSARHLAPSLCSADILAYLLAAERRAAAAPEQHDSPCRPVAVNGAACAA